jgi:3-hydroxy-9,10-secoandrosta-1,3,5(10)-triene-9,17-dione monooxygenase
MRTDPLRAATSEEVIARARALVPGLRARAGAAEEARRMPPESVAEFIDAGLARILVPTRFGGYGLGLDTWFEVVREISAADASHGWCASLLIHHPHMVGQFAEQAQKAVWAEGPDVPIAASVLPTTRVTRDGDGFRISGDQSAFASGVDHCTWVIVGGCCTTVRHQIGCCFSSRLASTACATRGSPAACGRPAAIRLLPTTCSCP